MFGKKVDVIEKIHEDFEKAGDELLNKANELLEEQTVEQSREVFDALNRFGFDGVKEVKEHKELVMAQSLAKATADKAGYYKEKYPGHVFLVEDQVRDICKKYGLVFGPTSAFIGEIPDKNKLEIASFKVMEEDDFHKAGQSEFSRGKDIKIVASKDEFDLKGHNLENGWKLKEIPKDPIVLYPVKYGYLVVSKWGKEEDISEIK